jgi:predicted DNA-binding protein (MmcQ/YjbR family)
MVSAADLRKAEKRLLKYALAFPEAYEDHPWGENVAKVNKKVFVFLGVPRKDRVVVCAKLPQSADFAFTFPFTEVAGHGLGKAGWVLAQFGPDDDIPVDMLEDWIDESYRAVAPKKLVDLLDE